MAVGRFRDDAVEFAGIDEIKAFGISRKGFHIDFQTKFSTGKIQDLGLFVPVMFHQYAFSHRMGAVDGTGKRFGAVRADLFQDRRLFIHEDIPFGERITCADEVLF